MSQTAWIACTSGADDATVGTVAWQNPSRITAGDGSYATATSTGTDTSHYLKALFSLSNADFGGLSGQIIDLVEFRVTRNANLPGVIDGLVKIVKAGTITGSNIAAGATWSNPGDELKVFDSSTSGVSLNQGDCTDPGFGVVMSEVTSPFVVASVDFVETRITYHAPPARRNGGCFLSGA